MYQNIIAYGFKNVYVCKTGSVPIPIKGALSVSIEIDIEQEFLNVGRKKVIMDTNKQASGELVLLGLNKDEMELLLGYKLDNNGGVIIDDGIKAPQLHLLFERQVADGSKILYHIFNVRFKQSSFDATTMIEGNLEENEVVLQMDIEYDEDYKGFYYMLKSSDNEDVANNWYYSLQYPKF